MRRHLAYSLVTVLSAASIGACWAIVVSAGGTIHGVTPDTTIATVLCLGVLMLVAVVLAMEVRSTVDDAVSSTQRAMHDLYEDHRPPVSNWKTAPPEEREVWRQWRMAAAQVGITAEMADEAIKNLSPESRADMSDAASKLLAARAATNPRGEGVARPVVPR